MSLINLNELKKDIRKSIESFKETIKGINTGRPRPEMLENLKVNAYSQDMDLKSLTSIEVIDGKFRLQPWDSSVLSAIEAAVRNYGKGLNPQSRDGAIYVSLPPLTQDTRKERVKELNTMLEEYKVSIRRTRHDYNSEVDAIDGVSEDEQKSTKKKIQELVDEANAELDKIAKQKEEELLDV